MAKLVLDLVTTGRSRFTTDAKDFPIPADL
jgi:hypothetical protein